MDRHPMDMATYREQAVNGPCFICRMLADDPDYAHEVVYEDADRAATCPKGAWSIYARAPRKHLAPPNTANTTAT